MGPILPVPRPHHHRRGSPTPYTVLSSTLRLDIGEMESSVRCAGCDFSGSVGYGCYVEYVGGVAGVECGEVCECAGEGAVVGVGVCPGGE